MLEYEDITKIQEIKGKFNKIWLSSGFNKIKNKFSWCKKSGISFVNLISTLLILPIIGFDSIHGFTSSKGKGLGQSDKYSYYRILVNQKINWRIFLAQFVKQYLLKEELFTPSQNA